MPQVLEMYQVDAFTKRVFAGNPAAVLILKDWLSDATMQAIAAENNLAETAFACPAEDGWKLRWFTPTLEVDFCGHATLATAHVLAWHHKIDGELNFYTRIGKISVSRAGDDYVLDVPSIAPDQLSELPAFIAPLFENESGATFFRNFENIYVQLEDEAAVRAFVPDHIQIENWDQSAW